MLTQETPWLSILMYLSNYVTKPQLNLMIHFVRHRKPSEYGPLTKEEVDGEVGQLLELMKTKGHISDTNNEYTFLVECLKKVHLKEAAERVKKFVKDYKAELKARQKAEQKAKHSEKKEGVLDKLSGWFRKKMPNYKGVEKREADSTVHSAEENQKTGHLTDGSQEIQRAAETEWNKTSKRNKDTKKGTDQILSTLKTLAKCLKGSKVSSKAHPHVREGNDYDVTLGDHARHYGADVMQMFNNCDVDIVSSPAYLPDRSTAHKEHSHNNKTAYRYKQEFNNCRVKVVEVSKCVERNQYSDQGQNSDCNQTVAAETVRSNNERASKRRREDSDLSEQESPDSCAKFTKCSNEEAQETEQRPKASAGDKRKMGKVLENLRGLSCYRKTVK